MPKVVLESELLVSPADVRKLRSLMKSNLFDFCDGKGPVDVHKVQLARMRTCSCPLGTTCTSTIADISKVVKTIDPELYHRLTRDRKHPLKLMQTILEEHFGVDATRELQVADHATKLKKGWVGISICPIALFSLFTPHNVGSLMAAQPSPIVVNAVLLLSHALLTQEQEATAATTIGAFARGTLARLRVARVTAATVKLQSAARGHSARKFAHGVRVSQQLVHDAIAAAIVKVTTNSEMLEMAKNIEAYVEAQQAASQAPDDADAQDDGKLPPLFTPRFVPPSVPLNQSTFFKPPKPLGVRTPMRGMRDAAGRLIGTENLVGNTIGPGGPSLDSAVQNAQRWRRSCK